MQQLSRNLLNASPSLLALDAAILLAFSFLRSAAVAAEVAGGPAALWGLTQPLTVEPDRLGRTLQLAAALTAAWSASAAAHGCAAPAALADPPAVAAARAGHAGLVAGPAALLLYEAVSGRGMAPGDLAAALVLPAAAMAAWRALLASRA